MKVDHTKLAKAREAAGLRRQDAIDALKIDKSTLSLIESGKRQPSLSMLLRFCQVYKIKPILHVNGVGNLISD